VRVDNELGVSFVVFRIWFYEEGRSAPCKTPNTKHQTSLNAMPTSAAPPTPAWSRGTRLLVSGLVVFHLVGVMVAPISTPPQFAGPPSILGSELQRVYRPYITAMFLDHAYKFFAPNPGPSHLLRYDLYFADGTKRVNADDQLLPDRFHHWPRLLYHRHFMLTEFLNDGRPIDAWVPEAATSAPTTAGTGEVLPPPNLGAPYVQPYLRSFAAYLARKHQAQRVELYYRIHLLPAPRDVLEGKPLDAAESYVDRHVLTYSPPGAPS
jgi:hypothetical protein